MKAILVLSILFCVIALPTFAELTEMDLENIRQIFREELGKPTMAPIDTNLDEIEATVDEIDTTFDSIHRSLDRIQMMLWIVTVLVVVAGIVNWMSILKSWRLR